MRLLEAQIPKNNYPIYFWEITATSTAYALSIEQIKRNTPSSLSTWVIERQKSATSEQSPTCDDLRVPSDSQHGLGGRQCHSAQRLNEDLCDALVPLGHFGVGITVGRDKHRRVGCETMWENEQLGSIGKSCKKAEVKHKQGRRTLRQPGFPFQSSFEPQHRLSHVNDQETGSLKLSKPVGLTPLDHVQIFLAVYQSKLIKSTVRKRIKSVY